MRPRVGISRCLLGDEVRFDGGHKRHASLVSSLSMLVEWMPVCPEVELGMGIPREPIQLVARSGGSSTGRLALVGVQSGTDWTARMRAFSRDRVRALAAEGLCGYVLKSRSPSCGLRAEVIVPGRPQSLTAPGAFAGHLIASLPNLPVVEETALDTPEACAHFLERVRAYQRLRT